MISGAPASSMLAQPQQCATHATSEGKKSTPMTMGPISHSSICFFEAINAQSSRRLTKSAAIVPSRQTRRDDGWSKCPLRRHDVPAPGPAPKAVKAGELPVAPRGAATGDVQPTFSTLASDMFFAQSFAPALTGALRYSTSQANGQPVGRETLFHPSYTPLNATEASGASWSSPPPSMPAPPSF